jgi:hypothetical protein
VVSTFMEDEGEPLVRPFFLTRGRTDAKLPVEAMVMSSPDGVARVAGRTPEYRAIVDLCVSEPRAVAEVAGRLGLPLGVARVLVGDLAEEGVVKLASTYGAADPEADTGFLDRIIAGVENL